MHVTTGAAKVRPRYARTADVHVAIDVKKCSAKLGVHTHIVEIVSRARAARNEKP